MSYPKSPSTVETHYPKVSSMSIIGHTTSNSCRLWVRTYCEGIWWLVVTTSPLEGDLDRLEGKEVSDFLSDTNVNPVFMESRDITNESCNTAVFDINTLQPATQYFYALIADKQHADEIPRRTEIGHHKKKSFRTLPAQPESVCFGFYSCHDPFSNRTHGQGAWPDYRDSLHAKRALFSIGGGDQMYIDTNKKKDMYDVWEWLAKYKNDIIQDYRLHDGSLDKLGLINYFSQIYQNYYRTYWNFSDLKEAFARIPQYMIWDDHEIMDGWGSYSRDERRKLLNKWLQHDDEDTNDVIVLCMFEAAKRVYYQFQHAHNPDTGIDLSRDNSELQWDYNFDVGDFGFYVLDMRGHHDYERSEQGNALLGDKQMQRFKSWLDNARGNKKALFVVSPVPVVHWGPLISHLDFGEQKDDLRDEWEHTSNHAEREVLLDAVFEFSHSQQCPVVFLSGDVHSASVFSLEDEDYPAAKVFNATSSAISRQPAPHFMEMAMKKSGRLGGYKDGKKGRVHRHYALSGKHNFITVDANTDDKTSITISLCWPGGSDEELVQRNILLT
jgi:alkaline phosphatase D